MEHEQAHSFASSPFRHSAPCHLLPASWLIHDRTLDLSTRALIMGIVNVTPDSFSDGGRWLDESQAVTHGLQLLAEGADILDIGGESTRPGAQPVSLEEELRRTLPVIRSLRAQSEALISIDTFKASVAEAAIEAGADIINDISGLTRDPRMIDVAKASDCGLVVMHMKGEPRTMQANPTYADVVEEVRAFFTERLRTLEDAGIDPQRVALDPGIGFGKSLEHNLALLRALPEFQALGRPLLLGVSRKTMIGKLLGDLDMAQRDWPTVALTSWLREQGARILRVHEVKPNVEALRMTEAILRGDV
jgi:dihydropteroate synthase